MLDTFCIGIRYFHTHTERNFKGARPLMGGATDHRLTTRAPSGEPFDLHICLVRTCEGVSPGKGQCMHVTCPCHLDVQGGVIQDRNVETAWRW